MHGPGSTANIGPEPVDGRHPGHRYSGNFAEASFSHPGQLVFRKWSTAFILHIANADEDCDIRDEAYLRWQIHDALSSKWHN